MLSGLLVLVCVLPAFSHQEVAAVAQEEAAEEEEDRSHLPPVSFEGTLRIGRDEIPLPVYTSVGKPLFDLKTIVESLGGKLHIGPLEESHRFRVGGTQVILGNTSIVMTIDEEIVRLPQSPVVSQSGLMVPEDALENSYGAALEMSFVWYESERVLAVERKEPRLIRVAASAVDIQGISTVVLEFSAKPRYRVRQRGQRLEIDFGSDRLESVGSFRSGPGSLVGDVEVADRSVRLTLAPGTVAAEPYELRRSRFGSDGFRLVFDVSRQHRADSRRGGVTSSVRTIVLDPGHGGSEQGAIGPAGSEEKALTLALARMLRDKLEARLPVRVILTRDEDADLPLETRTALANQNSAELFLSIHLNASASRRATGAETFFLSLQASDEQAAETAAAENLSPGAAPEAIEEAGLELILWDLAQTHHLNASQTLATFIQAELNGALGLLDRGVRQAPFAVLMGATMPAVLLELGFISNPDEEERLIDPLYRSDLLDAVIRAVVRYYVQQGGTRAASLEIFE